MQFYQVLSQNEYKNTAFQVLYKSINKITPNPVFTLEILKRFSNSKEAKGEWDLFLNWSNA